MPFNNGPAGIPRKKDLLKVGLFDVLYAGFVRASMMLVPMARSLGSSPYDRYMRRIHNYMKESEEFQKGEEGARVVEFPPMTAWMVFTDMVGHSCTAGQHALVNTFQLPKENCRLQEYTPYEVLRAYAQEN